MHAAGRNIPFAGQNIPTGLPYGIPTLIDMLADQPAYSVLRADMFIKDGRITFASEERGVESTGVQISCDRQLHAVQQSLLLLCLPWTDPYGWKSRRYR